MTGPQSRSLEHVDAAMSALAEAMQARVDVMAEAMLERYQERIPSYRDAPPEVMADARAWARNSVIVVIAIITGKSQMDDFVEPLIAVGRRRSQQGFPLHDVLQANLIGTEILWETMWSLAPADVDQRLEIVSRIMPTTTQLLQHAVAAISTGYLELERGGAADGDDETQALVETLAGFRPPDLRHRERAQRHGIDPSGWVSCFVVELRDEEPRSKVRSLAHEIPNAVVAQVGSTVIGYLCKDQFLGPLGARAGLAQGPDPARAYERARAALAVAIHLNRDQVRYDDVVPLAMILTGPAEEREIFVEAQLGRLLSDQMGEELVRSLQAYYAAGESIAAAARDLFIHRHTLEYRLQRIETLLGRNPKSPNERLLLEFALSLWDADHGD